MVYIELGATDASTSCRGIFRYGKDIKLAVQAAFNFWWVLRSPCCWAQ